MMQNTIRPVLVGHDLVYRLEGVGWLRLPVSLYKHMRRGGMRLPDAGKHVTGPWVVLMFPGDSRTLWNRHWVRTAESIHYLESLLRMPAEDLPRLLTENLVNLAAQEVTHAIARWRLSKEGIA